MMSSCASSASNVGFVDCDGSYYLVKDVPGNGDCALLALMNSPNFDAPISSSTELRRAIVSFARAAHWKDCAAMFSMVGDHAHMYFESYLHHALQPGFWVGTVFFLWASIAYGVDIRTHFFNEFCSPKFESSATFIKKYFMQHWKEDWLIVNVFFHQYRNMTRCKPSMYNHYASLVPLSSSGDSLELLNEAVNIPGTPWWKKTEEMKGYDCSQQPKSSTQKKNMNKDERKKLNIALTYHYIKVQSDGDDVAQEMEKKLEKAACKEEDEAVSSSSMDMSIDTEQPRKSMCRVLTATYNKRDWLMRANIIFLHLHPKIGNKDTRRTAELTGVQERTLAGWLSQKQMIKMWADIVEDMTAGVALQALPPHLQDVFHDVDPESTVSVAKYRKRIGSNNNIKLIFKGGKVSCFVCL